MMKRKARRKEKSWALSQNLRRETEENYEKPQ